MVTKFVPPPYEKKKKKKKKKLTSERQNLRQNP